MNVSKNVTVWVLNCTLLTWAILWVLAYVWPTCLCLWAGPVNAAWWWATGVPTSSPSKAWAGVGSQGTGKICGSLLLVAMGLIFCNKTQALFLCTKTALPKRFWPYKKTDFAILVISGNRNWSYTISVGPILFSLQGDRGCHADYRELFLLCILKALAFMVDIFTGPVAVTLWRFCTTSSTEIFDLGLGSEG